MPFYLEMMPIQQENIKIHHKTHKSTDEKYSFSSLYLTIGKHTIGDVNAESMTELLISEIEQMLSDARTIKSSWDNKNRINEAVYAFPKHNECFDGEKGFLAFLDEKNAILNWKEYETDQILATIVNFDHYIEQWETVLNELKNETK